jgi:hypothetical protein
MSAEGLQAMWVMRSIPREHNQPEVGAEALIQAYLAIPSPKTRRIVEIRSWAAKMNPKKRFEGGAKDEKPTEGNRTQSSHTRMQGT